MDLQAVLNVIKDAEAAGYLNREEATKAFKKAAGIAEEAPAPQPEAPVEQSQPVEGEVPAQ